MAEVSKDVIKHAFSQSKICTHLQKLPLTIPNQLDIHQKQQLPFLSVLNQYFSPSNLTINLTNPTLCLYHVLSSIALCKPHCSPSWIPSITCFNSSDACSLKTLPIMEGDLYWQLQIRFGFASSYLSVLDADKASPKLIHNQFSLIYKTY